MINITPAKPCFVQLLSEKLLQNFQTLNPPVNHMCSAAVQQSFQFCENRVIHGKTE